LALFPRKVIVDEEDLPAVVPDARRFLSFLDATGLLDSGSHPLSRLHDELDRLTQPFLDRNARHDWLRAGQVGPRRHGQRGLGPRRQ
jgi:hypothetical protein